jgi:Ca2+-binding EF-hand superfamily protein
MIDKLKHYFISLDEDGSNSVSPNELEDPLILFGLCKDKEEVSEFFKGASFSI